MRYMMLLGLAIVATAANGAKGQDAALKNLPGQPDGFVETSNEKVTFDNGQGGAGDLDVVKMVSKPGAGYLIVTLSDIRSSKGDFRVVVTDSSGTEAVGGDLVVREGGPGATAHIFVDGPAASFKVVPSSSGAVSGGFTVDQIAFRFPVGRVQSIIGADQREQLAGVDDAVIVAAADAVARVIYTQAGSPFVCSGFLVGSSSFITNEHCVATQATCASTFVQFGYQFSKNGNLQQGQTYSCQAVKRVNADLDYAVLTLAPGPDGRQAGEVRRVLEVAATPPTAGQKVTVIGHPAGEPKQVSRKDCVVHAVGVDGRVKGVDLQHSCDTLGGNSGSPVIDANGKVVGLHHYGDQPDSNRTRLESSGHLRQGRRRRRVVGRAEAACRQRRAPA